MKDLTLRNIAAACGGTYHGPEEFLDTEVSSVTTDSREAKEGALYIPMKGRRDGHDFIANAAAAGALAVLTERADAVPGAEPAAGDGAENAGDAAQTLPYILVEDTAEAIQKIAGFYRRALGLPVVGITGSVGKTSTKEMVASVLAEKYRVLKTAGNFNNNLGLPLTIFRLTEEDEIAVLEMGINHFGEMTWLADTARPDTMLITNIGTCHLEALGDRNGVFAAKTECFPYVNENGTVVLNGEDDKLIAVDEVHGRRPVFYGFSPRFRVYADEIKTRGILGSRCTIHIDEEEFTVDVPLPGEHMILNALAAAAVGSLYGVPLGGIKRGIEACETLSGRMHIVEGAKATVIDDCYNANPMSMKASLSILADTLIGEEVALRGTDSFSLPATSSLHKFSRRIAILGDMGELGETEQELHREVGTYAADLPVDQYILVGKLAKEIAKGLEDTPVEEKSAPAGSLAAALEGIQLDAAESDGVERIICIDTVEELIPRLDELIRPEDLVLVKASHFMGFERIVEALL